MVKKLSLNVEQLRELYKATKGKSVYTPKDLRDAAKARKVKVKDGTFQKMEVASTILHKLAAITTEEEFMNSFETGEIPPLKLSNREMEFLQGGGWLGVAGAWLGGVCLIAGAIACPPADLLAAGVLIGGAIADGMGWYDAVGG